ncbi:MAG: dicarboxylate/amino acid:cation symporter, partial [Bacteriovoracaceae bacterium]|nr:dicarboxylate/amino acid:cation symporter [Bacteriovoracaceae bacterium]
MLEGNKKDAQRIAIAMVAGLALGLILYFTGKGEWAGYIKPIGTVFIRLLKMVIVPLVFSSIFMAMFNLGTPEALGSMGRKAVGYYFVTTCVAVFFGIVFVNIFNPGIGADLGTAGLDKLAGNMATRVTEQKGLYDTILGVLVGAVPSNPVGSMANSKVLQIIVFSMLFGVVALYHPKSSEPMINVISSLEKMMLSLTHGIMKFAPLGIFVLMTDVMAKTGFTAIISLSKYMLTVIVGLTCHAIFLLFVACTRSKKSPKYILKGISSALVTAFSTSSSAATLPITMTCVEEELGVRKDTAKFVLPLG